MARIGTHCYTNSATGKRAEVEVHFDRDAQEYTCKLFTLTPCTRNYVKNADYFTDDKTDAWKTAEVMAKQSTN